MKTINRLTLVVLLLMISTVVTAQIPYFGGSQGKGKTYTYLSYKKVLDSNNQQTYIAVQHGLLNKLDLAVDYASGTGYSYAGFGFRGNLVSTKHFTLGGQSMASLDLNNKFKFSYLSNGLYIDGNIVDNLGYCSNTWFTVTKGAKPDWTQWSYLYYSLNRVTPMVGLLSNLLSGKSDLAVGVYGKIANNSYLYIWTANLLHNLDNNTKLVVGIDYKF